MNPKYKRKPRMVPHCGDCEEELKGEGSIMIPYSCSCGKWEYEPDIDKDKYRLKQ